MNIKRFFGKNSKLALSKVREAFGDDAVILSNSSVKGGNEIMAFSADEMDAIPSYGEPEQTTSEAAVIEDTESSTLEALFRKRMQSDSTEKQTENIDMGEGLDMGFDVEATLAQTQEQAKQVNAQMASMMHEIRNMRSVIESQLAEISWGATQHREPVKSTILGTMLSAGFSAGLSKQLAENIPAKKNQTNATKWVQSILLKNLNTVSKEDEILAQGGTFAIIGPTGVGKTTTTAKLAARYVMKYGAEKIGLITTDSYRIGGHEQLRIYGKILGVMVHSVKDSTDLKIALKELKNKKVILIDTVGVSQRDKMVSEQISMLSARNTKIKKLLCLNATSTGDTLIDVVKAYKGQGLAGCIMTKMDEAMTIGNVLDVIVREKLKLYYVTNGQRVPEDLHLPHKQQLIHHAFRRSVTKSSPFKIAKEDLPLVVGNTVRAASKSSLLEFGHA